MHFCLLDVAAVIWYLFYMPLGRWPNPHPSFRVMVPGNQIPICAILAAHSLPDFSASHFPYKLCYTKETILGPTRRLVITLYH